MSHTWVDGEVITAEKLNGMYKEPLVINTEDLVQTEVYIKNNTSEDTLVPLKTTGYVVIDDLNKYANNIIYISNGFFNAPVTYAKFLTSVLNPNDFSAGGEKCTIEVAEAIILRVDGGSTILVIDDPTILADTTGR